MHDYHEEIILAGRNFPLGLAALPGLEGTGATLWYGPGLMVSAPEGTRQEAALNVLGWFFSPEAQDIVVQQIKQLAGPNENEPRPRNRSE